MIKSILKPINLAALILVASCGKIIETTETTETKPSDYEDIKSQLKKEKDDHETTKNDQQRLEKAVQTLSCLSAELLDFDLQSIDQAVNKDKWGSMLKCYTNILELANKNRHPKLAKELKSKVADVLLAIYNISGITNEQAISISEKIKDKGLCLVNTVSTVTLGGAYFSSGQIGNDGRNNNQVELVKDQYLVYRRTLLVVTDVESSKNATIRRVIATGGDDGACIPVAY